MTETKPSFECQKCHGEGMVYHLDGYDPIKKQPIIDSWACPHCKGTGRVAQDPGDAWEIRFSAACCG